MGKGKSQSIIIVGAGGVGKSCLCIRYIKDSFMEDYDPTIEENHVKSTTVDGKPVKIDIIDTAGQEEFKAFRDATLGYGDGFLLVYSVNKRPSWEQAQQLYKFIQKATDCDLPAVVLVGNKMDLGVDPTIDQEVQQFCSEHNLASIKTSAKTGENVTQMFELAVRETRKYLATAPARADYQGRHPGKKNDKCLVS